MKKAIFLSLLLTIATISVPKGGSTPSKNELAHLVIATYNITHGKKNNWPKRKPGAIKVTKDLKADILCVQEAITANDLISDQIKAIQDASPEYAFVGEPRSSSITSDIPFLNRLRYWVRMTGIPFTDYKAQDEYCPIFYNKNKFDLIETETFSINGNGSAYLPRICTRARLKLKNTEQPFDVYNTHLDNYKQEDRLMQLGIITGIVNQRSKNLPAILAGDFNTELTDDIKTALATGKLTSAKERAAIVEGVNWTHKKKDKATGQQKNMAIDHIFTRPADAFDVEKYETSDTMSDETSDHNPVSMTFSLK